MTGVFATILRGSKWLLRHWYIPLFALVAVAGWLLGQRKQLPTESIGDELAAIRRRQGIDQLAAEKGASIANAFADQRYHQTLRALDEKQRHKAEDLRRHPGKRLDYLRRVEQRLRKRADDNEFGPG
jgi:hypothetical protein